jgi:hypothetical protein
MKITVVIPTGIVLLLCTLFPASADVVLDKGSVGWSMLNSNVDPAGTDADFNTTWFNPTVGDYTGVSYDGPAFTPALPAPFQYDNVDGLTGGTTLVNKVTTYFYKVIDGGEGYAGLKLSLLADDGAFVYLNGVLIARDSVNDPDTYTQFSSGTGSETNYDDIPFIGIPVIKPGPNLLAISVHNRSAGSSDLGFDLKLEGGPILVGHESSGWAMLSPIDPSTSDGYDPVIGHGTQVADADFNTTWRNQALGEYAGVVYDGPAFTTGHQGPFQYGGVDGIPAANTTIPIPDYGTRGSAYFVKTFDGGVSGYHQAEFSILADDGAFIYLNGNLVGVVGDLVADAAQDTWGKQTGDGGSESTFHTISVSGFELIKPGINNLLAVSMHQTNTTSSDLGLSLQLVGKDLKLPAITRGPYLQQGSHDRMTVRWRTVSVGNTVLRYGDALGNLTQTVTLDPLVTEHEVTVTGLNPATTYFYQIETTNAVGTTSAGADSEHYFKTHPASGERTAARIWVIGDSGTTTAAKDDVYNAYRTRTGSTHTDVWLMLGDNAYNNGTDSEFQNAVFDSYPELLRNTVMWSCIGNHESYTSGGAPYVDIHSFPTAAECGGVASGSERYYSYDHGNIHFVCLDSQTGGNYNDTPGGGGMVDWLELDLQATDKDWIIAYFHHGPYTKGSHNSDIESHHIQIRRYVTPLLEKYGVDLVLSGHSHCYERSMLINGHHSNFSDTASSLSDTFVLGTHGIDTGNGSDFGSVDGVGAFLTSGFTGVYEKPLADGEKGTVYTICGASGKLSSWTGGSTALINPAPHPVFVVNLRIMGSMILTVEGNRLKAQYIDGANTIRDDFTLVKGTTIEVTATDDSFAEHGADDTATFTLTRSGATSFAEDVTYQVSGSALNGGDYSPMLTGSVSFAADETSKQLTVTRVADSLAEGSEAVQVAMTVAQQVAGSGGTLRDRYFLGPQVMGSATLADKPSQDWWFGQLGATVLTDALWKLDTDNDRLDRLLEYAFGGDIGTDDSALLPSYQFSGNTLELYYSQNNALTDLTFSVLTSTDLSDWTETGVIYSLDGPANPAGVESRKGAITLGSGETKRFLRLRIEK